MPRAHNATKHQGLLAGFMHHLCVMSAGQVRMRDPHGHQPATVARPSNGAPIQLSGGC